MLIEIDYQPITTQVIIKNDGTDPNQWNSFRIFLNSYIPITSINYSERRMVFNWVYFLELKPVIASFAKAHHSSIKIQITKNAKEMLLSSDSVSYKSATENAEKDKVSEIEIINKLTSVGFSRKLTDNQMANVRKIVALPAAATFSVPGAGKTTEALAFFFYKALPTDRLLVVAPKNAFSAWDEQLIACVPTINDNFVRLRGGEDSISAILDTSPRFMLITYDQLPRVRFLMEQLLVSGNVFMFLDESHRIKGGSKVKRGEAVQSVAFLPKYKLIMSGTPMPQSTNDLIPQFNFLYPTKQVSSESVVSTFSPIYVRTNQQQLGIPSIHYRLTELEMPVQQRKIYEVLKSEVKRQMNPMISPHGRFALRQIGKSVMKVMEFVSNPSLLANDMSYIFDPSLGKLLLATDGPKIGYVCARAHELANQNKKVIVWSTFVQNVELLALRLQDLGAVYIHGGVDAGSDEDEDTREGKIKKFHDDPNCMVMIANPAACAEGISLHKVCQYAIYLDRSFNAAHYLQSEDRIHRLGMPENTFPTVEIVECKNSIDQVIRERLDAKVNAMARALNDSALRVDPNGYDYNDDEDDDFESLIGISEDDLNAIIHHFFSEG